MMLGNYIMTWAGYSQPVKVFMRGFNLMFRTKSGYEHSVDSVPEATWEVVSSPEETQ